MGLVCFAALVLLGLTLELSAGVWAQSAKVLQSPESMSATAGESATFSCTLTLITSFSTRYVRWYKGSGESRTLIYSSVEKEGDFPRVSPVSPWPSTAMSITMYNLTSEDTGTYFCVIFHRNVPREQLYKSGAGTCLFVSADRAQMITVSQSPVAIQVTTGDSVTFSCTVSVPPCNLLIGPVRWYKGSHKDRTVIYSDDGPLPHVSRVSPKSSTDWSIRITNISTQDTGTYYCMKFVSGVSQEEEYQSGTGISLSVSVGAPDSSGFYISSQAFWVGFVVEKLCLMAVVLGVVYLKQRN